jgi:16S rRNA G1207 methylase RsmC
VLDLGCGYGIIGLAAARRELPEARVTMVDDDLLAVRCARASVRANETGSALHGAGPATYSARWMTAAST